MSISKQGTVLISGGILTVTGYEFSELTWTQEVYRSAIIQALDDAEQTIHLKRAEVSGNIDVRNAPQEKGIGSAAIIAKGRPVPDVIALPPDKPLVEPI